jgi:hypothetical protein
VRERYQTVEAFKDDLNLVRQGKGLAVKAGAFKQPGPGGRKPAITLASVAVTAFLAVCVIVPTAIYFHTSAPAPSIRLYREVNADLQASNPPYKDSVGKLEQILLLDNNDHLLGPHNRARCYIYLADGLFRNNDHEGAYKAIQAAIKLYESNILVFDPPIYNVLVEAAKQSDGSLERVKICRLIASALSKNPRDDVRDWQRISAVEEFAILLSHMGRNKDAQYVLAAMRPADGTHRLYARSVVALEGGLYKTALADSNHSVDNPYRWKNGPHALSTAVRANIVSGDWDRAIFLCSGIPRKAPPMRTCGIRMLLRLHSGNTREAASLAEELIKRGREKPENVIAFGIDFDLKTYAAMLKERGREAEAKRILNISDELLARCKRLHEVELLKYPDADSWKLLHE